MKRNYLLLFGLVLMLGLSACDKKVAEQNNVPAPGHSTMQKIGPEYLAAYICPMYCEGSGSDKPGKCPVCGMDYRENKDYKDPKATEKADSTH